MSDTMDRIYATGLVPVVVIDIAETAVSAAKALLAGGVDIMEITLRTEAGLESIKRVSEACPDMLVGGGTVLTMEQCKTAIEYGAKFIVSPGFNPEIVKYCLDNKVDICPGCVTPTEIDIARRAGLKVLKFFPADIYGGLKAIKALRGPFSMIRFIPTGGVNLTNLIEFNDPAVYAVGGGWLCDKKLIKDGNYSEITDICKKSVDILLGLKDEESKKITFDELIVMGGAATTNNLTRAISQMIRRGFMIINKTNTSAELVNNSGEIRISINELIF